MSDPTVPDPTVPDRTGRIPAGLTTERVGFFTDAVFAIAMTLLVIEIPRPEDVAEFAVGDGVGKAEAARNLLGFLYGQTGSFVAYVLAFYLLWNAWRSHHTLFDRIDRLSRGLLRWHFALLLLVGFLPYPTAMYGHHTGNPAAAGIFAIAVAALLICRSGVQTQALRDGLLSPTADTGPFRVGLRASWIVACYWTATIALVWWTPWVIVAWAGAPLLGSILVHRVRPPTP